MVLAALPELSLHIVEFAREHGRVTMGDAMKLTGASRNTLKQHFSSSNRPTRKVMKFHTFGALQRHADGRLQTMIDKLFT